MRLNGWQRIGVVVSCLWAIGGAFLGHDYGIHQGDYVLRALARCLEHQTDWDPCHQAFSRDWPVAIADHWLYAAVVGLIPIPLGWLGAYGGIALVRWIRSGFKLSD